MATFGLIGKNIEYSFSKQFFEQKFKTEKRKDEYHIFDLSEITKLHKLIAKNENLKGFNVTIPYKQSIIPFLDSLDSEAKKIGAINTVKINKNRQLIGYNTDVYGFAKSLFDFLPLQNSNALLLGNGGASKAVKYVLETMNIKVTIVSRTKSNNNILYQDINSETIKNHSLIVNCTPLGTYPNIQNYPKIPYQFITNNHVLFDLTYNPKVTEFMKLGTAQGANVTNGLKMLELQAEKSWEIWSK